MGTFGCYYENSYSDSIALTGCLFLSGCVVGRRSVPLSVPQTPAATPIKGEFVITAVEDVRHFENKPSTPDIASIDGDVTKASPAELAPMIGRQRNTYGKALGDITLPTPDTVKTKATELIEEGLRRSGYTVSKGNAGPNTVSAKVDDFWAWFTPGMWSVGFNAHIRCHVTLTKGDKTATLYIQGKGENRGQMASDANWQLAYQRAFEDFLNNFRAAMEHDGF